VFCPSQPIQALAIVRVTAGVGAKKKLSAKTPVEESQLAAGTTPLGVGVLIDSSQSASTPTRALYRFTKLQTTGVAKRPCTASGTDHHPAVDKVGVRHTVGKCYT